MTVTTFQWECPVCGHRNQSNFEGGEPPVDLICDQCVDVIGSRKGGVENAPPNTKKKTFEIYSWKCPKCKHLNTSAWLLEEPATTLYCMECRKVVARRGGTGWENDESAD